jgi:multisubunit Na+/H+ antiporter MnhG subunit
MDIMIALVTSHIGGPIGVVFILLGVIGILRNKRASETGDAPRGWPAPLIVVGVILVILAAGSITALANTNFGL